MSRSIDIDLVQPARLLALERDELLTLFRELPAAEVEELDGEYAGYNHIAATAEGYARALETLEITGSTRWLGKAFSAEERSGYNYFLDDGGAVLRYDRFSLRPGTSLLDGRPSLKLVYSDYRNAWADQDLVDEVRRVMPGLYLAFDSVVLSDGGRSRPEPFVIAGPATPWVGVDDERHELRTPAHPWSTECDRAWTGAHSDLREREHEDAEVTVNAMTE